MIYQRTADGLRLPGVHYEPGAKKDICVVLIHGMTGNILENYFAHVLGQILAKNSIGFIYGHNRGYNYINDIPTKKISPNGGYVTRKIGATYERFNECVFDIDCWLKTTQKLGYKKIILAGHSLGCNKVIHYLASRRSKNITGVILLSPPDMVGLAKLKRYQKNYPGLLKEARKNVLNKNPEKLLPIKVWDWLHLSSQTFLDFFEDNGPTDNLPVLRNPGKFKELSSIKLPILGIMGGNDDIAIRTLEEDLGLIAKMATNSLSFTKTFIPKANHLYDRQESVLAKVVLKWILKNFHGKRAPGR